MTRADIYYWKCDRPAAFHGTESDRAINAEVEQQLLEALGNHFNDRAPKLRLGIGQGNHLTWLAEVNGAAMFVRVENGPEKDKHLAVESVLLDRVRECGVPTPRVYGCDATRRHVPFAWQALEYISAPDLNRISKEGCLDERRIAFGVGEAMAKWQSLSLPGFGVPNESLRGYHDDYPSYFRLRLETHLDFLVDNAFLSLDERAEIADAIEAKRQLLNLDRGCLVHKDLALWNVLGTTDRIAAFIDFDDAISGDPTDDLSLLACFHNADFLQRAFDGYQSVRSFPDDWQPRFWLHLLRNLLVKAVIRVGAGYFQRDSQFFLIGSGSHGEDLRRFTRARMAIALKGLRESAGLEIL